MIVNQVQEGWEIIHQPAHGILAAQIALQFPVADFPDQYRMDTIGAIMDHDDYQSEYESHTYVTEVGAPRDFTLLEMNANERYEQVQRVLSAAYEKSCWTGLLISFHFNFLYQGEPVKKRLTQLLEYERERRPKILKDLDLNFDTLETTYQIMRFCDRCSLILSRDEIPAMERRLEIITRPDDQRFEIWQDAATKHVHVSPWCFDDSEFTVAVDVRTLRQLHFKNDQALQEALKTAPVERKSWIFAQPED